MIISEKQKIKIYQKYIFDVGLEISQSNYWRNLLFSSDYNFKFLFDQNTEHEIPEYLKMKKEIFDYNLQFYISKVLECPEEFAEGCIIFKFESVEFPQVVSYSGN